MKLLYKLERRFGRFAVPNLMLVIVIGMGIVFVADMFFPDYNIISYLVMRPSLIMQGEVWRVLTFIFVPVPTTPILVVLALYFQYFIGSAMESAWGAYKFGVFYFISIIATVIGGFALYFIWGAVSPSAAQFVAMDNYWLNLSLFIAFAILYPNMQVRLFFIIPIKVKWLAIIDAVAFAVSLTLGFVFGNWNTVVAIIAALLNLALFFGGELIRKIKDAAYYAETRRRFRREMRKSNNNQNRY